MRLPAALHSWSQTALGILRMARITSPCVWEITKELQWEILVPGSTQPALNPQNPVPVLGGLNSAWVWGRGSQKGPFCDCTRHGFPIIYILFLLPFYFASVMHEFI